MVFHWCLSNIMFPQVSKSRLSSLADMNNAVFWMISISPLISNWTNILVAIPSAPFHLISLSS